MAVLSPLVPALAKLTELTVVEGHSVTSSDFNLRHKCDFWAGLMTQ
ncbi:MAG: hypothetical protein ACRBCS_07870 [Cellvibrionaceae bacterium]